MMKKTLLTMMMLLGIVAATFAQSGTMTVKFAFKGIEEGYDHLCKTQVWVDGQMVGESAEVKESVGATFTVKVPTGSHHVRVINLAYYEGSWEEHTVENNYSIDCFYNDTYTLKASNKLFMLHDIDSVTLTSWKKMPKVKKKKK
jgi:hypothetical protein